MGTKENGRGLHLFLVRHGEQEDYRTNSHLSEVGKKQVIRSFADPFVERLSERGESIVKIYSSGKIRALESGGLIQNYVEEKIDNGELPNTRILKLRERSELQITDPISKILAKGGRPKFAFMEWQMMPEFLLNKVFNTDSIRQVSEDIDRSINSIISGFHRKMKEGPEINMVFVTHETTVGALAKTKLLKNRPFIRIAHAESLRVSVENEEIIYSFRGKDVRNT